MPVWLTATVAGFFGLFYAYVVWNTVTLLVAQAGGPLGLNGLGWFVLLLAVVFPVIAFAVAFAVGWRRRVLPFAAILLAGLALVAVFWLNVVALAYSNGASFIGA